MTKTAVGAPAPKPTPDDILSAIDTFTVVQLLDIGKALDELLLARGAHIHAYTKVEPVGDGAPVWMCRCGDQVYGLLY